MAHTSLEMLDAASSATATPIPGGASTMTYGEQQDPIGVHLAERQSTRCVSEQLFSFERCQKLHPACHTTVVQAVFDRWFQQRLEQECECVR
jgi:hypothetical protein